MIREHINTTKPKRRKLNNTEDEVLNNIIPSVLVNQSNRLDRDFYNVPCETLAKALLRKILVRRLDCGTLLKGRIVETECYLGGEDKASHSFNGRRTKGNEPMYMVPGTAYVYFTYGMYHCFNISSDGPGAAVLLRAVEPILGMEKMQDHRKTEKRKKELKVNELCNGPAKLCISFNINKADFTKADLTVNEHMWIEDDFQEQNMQIVTTSRIGIDSAGEEWARKPLRFYILGNANVSKRDKIVEQIIIERS